MGLEFNKVDSPRKLEAMVGKDPKFFLTNAEFMQLVNFVNGLELDIEDLSTTLIFKSDINTASAAPTEQGLYFPTESGPYPNLGGIVIDLSEGLSIIAFNGTTFTKQVTPIELADYAKKELLENKADLVPGKNLLNKAAFIANGYIDNLGNIYASASYYYTDFIKVEIGQQYKLSYPPRYRCYYDVNKNFLSGTGDGVDVFTIPAGVHYVRLSGYDSTQDIWQLEKGSVSTTYEAYSPVLKPEQIDLSEYIKTTDLPALIDTKVDLDAGRNKFDKGSAVIGKYLVNNIEYTNATYDYSDYIAVEELANYVASHSMRFVTYLDINKNNVASAPENVTNLTIPTGVRFIRVTIYHTDLNAFQIEKGSVSTAYQTYKNVVGNDNLEIFQSQIINDTGEVIVPTFKLFLPKEVCIAVGRTIELYHNQISWCGNINDYHFVWSGIGKSMKRKWTCTGVTIGNNTLTCKVYNKNNQLVATKTTNVRVVSNVISTPFTVAAIGDSLSNQKPWPAEITSLSDNDITFVGTRNGGTSEGRSGATAEYYNGNFSNNFDSLGIVGNDGRAQDMNPFWSPVTSDVNYQYYKDNYSTPNPDKLIIWLGTNGIEVDPTANANYIKTFIDKIRATGGATIPIFVVHTLFRGNQDGIGKQEGTDGYVVNTAYKLEEDLKVFNLQEKLLEDLNSYSNVYLVPVSTCHDSEFNFGNVSTPVNPRASQVEFLPNEATHPQTQGYMQIADIIFSSLAANQ